MMSVIGLNKKSITTCHLTFIVKITLIWSYFKFISIEFKQNLGSGCWKLYFKGQNKKNIYIYIYMLGQTKGFIWTP